MLAQDRLILVCPQQSQNGEEQYPHPLWDELVGKIPDKNKAFYLEKPEIISPGKPKPVQFSYAPLPDPEPNWQVKKTDLLFKRDRESANSLSSLISCPFKWVVNYLGGLSSGLTASLSEPDELEGWFVHEIVSQVLGKGKQDPKAAAKEAEKIFDQAGPVLAAKFFLPGFDHIRSRVRNTVLSATEQIFQMIQNKGFDIKKVEESFEQKIHALGFNLEGRPDLVLNNPLAVLDLKRGGLKYRKSEIENGTSVQLAVYGQLLRKKENNPFPSAAYFILKAGQIITANAETFPHAMSVEGISLVETWKGIKESYTHIRQELDNGKVRAPGNEDEPLEDSALIDGKLYLVPCAFCDLGLVCGQSMQEER